MTPEEREENLKYLRRLQRSVLALGAIIVAFFALAAVGGAQQRAREIEKLREEQQQAEALVGRIMGAVEKVQGQVKAISDRAEVSEKDRAYLHGATDEIRKTVVETLKRLETTK
jgi:hypothetical protein